MCLHWSQCIHLVWINIHELISAPIGKESKSEVSKEFELEGEREECSLSQFVLCNKKLVEFSVK